MKLVGYLIIFCVAAASLLAVPLSVFLGGGSSGSQSAYAPFAAHFDGTNDWIGSSSVAGLSDGKQFTVSFWFDPQGGDGIEQYVYRTGSGRTAVFKNTSNEIEVTAASTGGTQKLRGLSLQTFTSSSAWIHVYICIDLTSEPACKMYFNGVEDEGATWPILINDGTVLDLDNNGAVVNRIGAGGSGLFKLNAYLSEFWFDDIYIDAPSSFISAGKPLSLGLTGEIPTGAVPAIYFSRSGSGDAWAHNSGQSVAWSVTGALVSVTGP